VPSARKAAVEREHALHHGGHGVDESSDAVGWGTGLPEAVSELPVIGAVVALATIGATMRRKGFFGGLLDTGLNALPFVGAAKNAAEIVRGRDFIRDRPAPPAA